MFWQFFADGYMLCQIWFIGVFAIACIALLSIKYYFKLLYIQDLAPNFKTGAKFAYRLSCILIVIILSLAFMLSSTFRLSSSTIAPNTV